MSGEQDPSVPSKRAASTAAAALCFPFSISAPGLWLFSFKRLLRRPYSVPLTRQRTGEFVWKQRVQILAIQELHYPTQGYHDRGLGVSSWLTV